MSSSGGPNKLASLRAMFEKKDDSMSTSPPDRGRSSGAASEGKFDQLILCFLIAQFNFSPYVLYLLIIVVKNNIWKGSGSSLPSRNRSITASYDLKSL